MKQNQDVNLMKLMEQYNSDDVCREILAKLRWHDGVVCPHCGSKSIRNSYTRDQYNCGSCGYQFSVTSGTIFHDSHLSLQKWFVATYLMVESKKGMSANQLKRTLGVSYKTAWYLCHRIRTTMVTEPGKQLSGTVELLKRSIIVSYHKVSVKHLDSYLDELEWRFNNRENPYLFRDTLMRLINSENLPYQELTHN